jgi:two-component system response regulator HydG
MNPNQVIGKSAGFQHVLDTAKSVAYSCSNVLITGESGTGKEVVAHAIHAWSPRTKKPFVPINCAAIPENLLESELFGYMKGAFTGANGTKPGLFEEAEGGTLFLDEIGDMPISLQAKLLRVLQEHKIKRVGENQYRNVDIRIIAATHEDLRTAVNERRFREDLFFRLNVIPIHIPPLRERKEDILPLAKYFLAKYLEINQKRSKGFTLEAEKYLLEQTWTGNVRELENAVERVVVLSVSDEITVEDLEFLSPSFGATSAMYRDEKEDLQGFSFEETADGDSRILPIEEMTQKYIQYVLALNKGAKNKTARELGIDRKTLYRKLHL